MSDDYNESTEVTEIETKELSTEESTDLDREIDNSLDDSPDDNDKNDTTGDNIDIIDDDSDDLPEEDEEQEEVNENLVNNSNEMENGENCKENELLNTAESENLSDLDSEKNESLNDSSNTEKDEINTNGNNTDIIDDDSEELPGGENDITDNVDDTPTEIGNGELDNNSETQELTDDGELADNGEVTDNDIPKTEGLFNRDYTKNWNKRDINQDYYQNLKDCNPNYNKGREYQENCQRCVPAYEMRNRGFDVEAKPAPDSDRDHLPYHPYDVWKSPQVINTTGSGMDDIKIKMAEWGDGSRAQVTVQWNNGRSGHTFSAEQIDGRTAFIDPQDATTDTSSYFKYVKAGNTQFARIDDLQPTKYINDCCKRRN